MKVKCLNNGEDTHFQRIGRSVEQMDRWGMWVRHTVELDEALGEDFENAPRYTHSCNRYFRPCSLIPFCADDAQGRVDQWEEMTAAPLSPSEAAVLKQT